jgi:hypothetical protein
MGGESERREKACEKKERKEEKEMQESWHTHTHTHTPESALLWILLVPIYFFASFVR